MHPGPCLEWKWQPKSLRPSDFGQFCIWSLKWSHMHLRWSILQITNEMLCGSILCQQTHPKFWMWVCCLCIFCSSQCRMVRCVWKSFCHKRSVSFGIEAQKFHHKFTVKSTPIDFLWFLHNKINLCQWSTIGRKIEWTQWVWVHAIPKRLHGMRWTLVHDNHFHETVALKEISVGLSKSHDFRSTFWCFCILAFGSVALTQIYSIPSHWWNHEGVCKNNGNHVEQLHLAWWIWLNERAQKTKANNGMTMWSSFSFWKMCDWNDKGSKLCALSVTANEQIEQSNCGCQRSGHVFGRWQAKVRKHKKSDVHIQAINDRQQWSKQKLNTFRKKRSPKLCHKPKSPQVHNHKTFHWTLQRKTQAIVDTSVAKNENVRVTAPGHKLCSTNFDWQTNKRDK